MPAGHDFERQDTEPYLPDGWRWVTLGELCVVNPSRPSGLQRNNSAPTTFVPMSAVDERLGMITRSEVRPFSEVRKGYTYFAEGDVLFAKITPCMENGKHAIAQALLDGFGFGTTEFHVVRPGPEITPEWIHYFLRQPSILEAATAHFTGAVGQRRVPDDFLITLPIPLPPISDQKRLAAILMEQLGAVEQARTATEVQLDAARALPAAYLRAIFNSPEAQRWSTAQLGTMGEITGGIQKTPERSPVRFHKPYLTVRNVQRGYLDLSQVERFEITQDELARYHLLPGDILIVEGNGSLDHIGRNALFLGTGEDWVHQNHLIRVRLLHNACFPKFVSHYLNSDLGRSQMVEKAMTTSGLYTLSSGKVASLEVPRPPLAEQQRIAALLSEQMAESERLRQSLQAQLDAINKLPAALLRRAFAGEL